MYPVLESAYKDRLDALKAMVCFYLVSTLSNCYAGQWLERSIAHRLFPQAHLSSSQVSDLLKYLGDPSRQQVFFLNYLQWFVDSHATDKLGHILIDSTGLPNSIHFSLTAISNHNGDINNEVRLIYVVQQTTGLPIYMRCVPGNIIDINTLKKRTILELKQDEEITRLLPLPMPATCPKKTSIRFMRNRSPSWPGFSPTAACSNPL